MTEAIKSIIWKRYDREIDGKKMYKYLIGTILVTDTPITGVNDSSDHIAMVQFDNENYLTNAFSRMAMYESPHQLGNLSDAVIDLSDMNPNDLTLKGT
jgi:phosphoribosylformylglycinamidine (FGAM) synthase-like enzyme